MIKFFFRDYKTRDMIKEVAEGILQAAIRPGESVVIDSVKYIVTEIEWVVGKTSSDCYCCMYLREIKC